MKTPKNEQDFRKRLAWMGYNRWMGVTADEDPGALWNLDSTNKEEWEDIAKILAEETLNEVHVIIKRLLEPHICVFDNDCMICRQLDFITNSLKQHFKAILGEFHAVP